MGKRNSSCACGGPSCAGRSSDIVGSSKKKFGWHLWDRSGRSFGLARELPRPVPEFSVASLSWHCGSIVELGQWVVIRHPRRHPDWRSVEPSTDGLTVRIRNRTCGRLDGSWSVESSAFPGSLLRALRQGARRERGLLSRHVVGAAHPRGWEHVGAPERSARWFLFPTHTWEPLLLTWVKSFLTRKVGFEGTPRLGPHWKSQPATYKVNLEWKLEFCEQRQFSLVGQHFSWSV